jgi:hypothetical protein
LKEEAVPCRLCFNADRIDLSSAPITMPRQSTSRKVASTCMIIFDHALTYACLAVAALRSGGAQIGNGAAFTVE